MRCGGMSESKQDISAQQAFLATASHEIRTPLNGILGTVSLLLETELEPSQREYAEAIKNSGARLLDLLNNVLDYARLDAGAVELETEPFNPARLAREVVELLSPRAHAAHLDIAVRARPGTMARARGDAGRIRQILFNLIGNALKFAESGGVLIDVSSAADTITYSIIDTGPGIAPEDRAALFDAFRQSSAADAQKDGGVGLGLAIVARLTEALGGQLDISGAPGHGTAFMVTLPVEVDTAAPAPANDAISGRIVLAGLPPATALSASAGLISAGCAVVQVDPYAETPIGKASIILASADLPTSVLSRLTANGPTIIVLRPEDRGALDQFRALGTAGWLVRPLRPRSLIERVRLVMAGAGADNIDERAAIARGGHVLVADDNPVNALIASRALEKSGFSTSVAATGSEALEAAAAMTPALILMDLRMPVMDGFEAMRQLRARGETMPIIAVSAEVNPDIEKQALSAGADAVAAKPLDAEALRQIAVKWTTQPAKASTG